MSSPTMKKSSKPVKGAGEKENERSRRAAQRLLDAGFAEKSRSKNERETGIITEVGPVVARSVLDYFAPDEGRNGFCAA